MCVRHAGRTAARQGPHRAPLARCFMETSCLSICSGNAEKSKTQHVKQDFIGTSGRPQRAAGGQGRQWDRLCLHTALDNNCPPWTSVCSFKTCVEMLLYQAWHRFNALNFGSDACLETTLTRKSTKHVVCFPDCK